MPLTPLPEAITVDELLLRDPTRADLDALIAAVQDPSIARWTRIPSPYGVTEAQEYLADCEAERASNALTRKYLIFDTNTGALLGGTGMPRVRADDQTGEIGYWVAPQARCRGVATRAAGALTAAVLRAGYERIEAEVITGNNTSCGVLERIGYTHEGILRSVGAHGCGDGARRIDVHVYSLLPSDPAAARLLAL